MPEAPEPIPLLIQMDVETCERQAQRHVDTANHYLQLARKAEERARIWVERKQRIEAGETVRISISQAVD